MRRITLAVALSAVLVGAATVPAVAASDVPYAGTAATTSWRVADGVVYSMAQVGDRIYLGGSFTSVRSPNGATTVARSRLLALDAATGALVTSWNPGANGVVRALTTDGTTLFAAGDFTTVGGQPRVRTVALDPGTGAVRSWRADASSLVRDIVFDGSRLLVAGQFTTIRGVARQRVAALSVATGEVDPSFRPTPSWTVNTVAPVPTASGVALGGYFTAVGGQQRYYLAMVDATTGAVRDWAPTPYCLNDANPCVIYDLVADGSSVYGAVGGPGGRAAAWRISDGSRRFNQYGDGDVQVVALSEGVLYAGGHFDPQFGSIGGRTQTRPQFGAIDADDGALLPYAPTPRGGGGVWAILPTPTALHIAGQFGEVAGDPARDRYARLARIGAGPDTSPPSAPTGLRSSGVTSSTATLAWDPAVDDRGVVRYDVFRDGVLRGSSTSTSWTDPAVSASTTYSYTVVAVDAAGNRSAPSGALRVTTPAGSQALVPAGATWRLYDAGTEIGTGWRAASFDDSGWRSGRAQLGYGDGDEATLVAGNRLAYAFRTEFSVSDPSSVSALDLRVLRDDGVVVWVNGTEVWRNNVPSGDVTFATRASTAIAGSAESTWLSATVPASSLVAGRNVIAVSVHNDSTASSDISFDLELDRL